MPNIEAEKNHSMQNKIKSHIWTVSYLKQAIYVSLIAVFTQCNLFASVPPDANELEIETKNINEGLLIHIPFDEGSGSTAHDRQGNIDAILHSNIQWESGVSGEAIRFDGQDDYASLSDSQLGLDQSDAFSIAFWIYREGNNAISSSQTIIKKGQYVYPFWIDIRSNRIRSCIRTSGTHYLSTASRLSQNTWYHVTLTYENNTRKLYLNGVLEAQDALEGTLSLRSNQEILIGKSASGDFLKARLDDFRYYNRGLLLHEIEELAGVESAPPEPEYASLTQHGITWRFVGPIRSGKFANGDYWVLGPVDLVEVTPSSQSTNGTWTNHNGTHSWTGSRTMNGSMINPSPTDGAAQGYDSETYAWHPNNGRIYSPNYDESKNAVSGINENNPLNLQPGQSLVSTISHDHGSRPQLATAAVLTVLDSEPPAGSFRPPYAGSDKSIRYNKNQLAYGRLGRLPVVPNTPSFEELERTIQRPWIDHVPDWLGRYIHPSSNMPNYGREMAFEMARASLKLQLDYSNEQKESLLISLVQIGIDNYGLIKNGGRANWRANGGHMNGRLWPILFAGIMLNDAQMQAIGQKTGNYLYASGHGPGNPPSDYIHFGETGQTFYVTQEDVKRTQSDSWDPDLRGGNPQPYTDADIGMPEWGITHSHAPRKDNREWATAYRECCTAISWSGQLLSAYIMNVTVLWNSEALFDYMDRYIEIQGSTGFGGAFERAMWEHYRAQY
jgi:hypothetical protein